jgi:magnesium-transporting ATPase (P-type)
MKILSTGADDRALSQGITVQNREGTDKINFKKMRELAEEYFILLALTHEVVPDVNKFGQKIYMGPSPDEVALVDAAREMDYEFMRSTQNESFLKIRDR